MAKYISLSKSTRENAENNSTGSSQSSTSSEVTIMSDTATLLESDYLAITFWKKESWRKHEKKTKDSLKLSNQQNVRSRGGARLAQGKNIMMQYLQEADGTMISGTIAGEIREHTRSIWRGFYKKGVAPLKWGDGSKDLRDHYCMEMESRFKVLRYCDNHWKSHTIATIIYSPWYHMWDKKMQGIKIEPKEEPSGEPAPKRPRTKSGPLADPCSENTPVVSDTRDQAGDRSNPIILQDPL